MRASTPTEVAYELLPFGLSEAAVVRMIVLECNVSELEATEAVRAAHDLDERVMVFS